MQRQSRSMHRTASLHDVVWLEARFELLCPGSLLVRADLAPLPVSPIRHACQLCCHLHTECLHCQGLRALPLGGRTQPQAGLTHAPCCRIVSAHKRTGVLLIHSKHQEHRSRQIGSSGLHTSRPKLSGCRSPGMMGWTKRVPSGRMMRKNSPSATTSLNACLPCSPCTISLCELGLLQVLVTLQCCQA